MSESAKPFGELFGDLAAKYEASTGGCTREIATHLIDILPRVDADSVVLDNACGNGIVAQELLFKYPDTPLNMTCVDGSKAMVDLARHMVPAVPSAATVSFDIMDGTSLSLPDDTYTHSVTNMGIFFFGDTEKGAQEIYRTLKPGGTAIATSWNPPGYLPVIHAAQKAVKPDAPLLKWPMSEAWFLASHLQEMLEKGGFRNVEIHEKASCFGAKSIEETCGYLVGMWKQIGPKWTEHENAQFEKQLIEAGKKAAVTVKRPVNVQKGAEIVELVGFPMVAHVAVAKK